MIGWAAFKLALGGSAALEAAHTVFATDGFDVWAPAVNTALLIVLALITARTHGRVKMTEDKIDAVHESVGHAASAAASAATVAADAARITKELGGMVRERRPERLTGATVATEGKE